MNDTDPESLRAEAKEISKTYQERGKGLVDEIVDSVKMHAKFLTEDGELFADLLNDAATTIEQQQGRIADLEVAAWLALKALRTLEEATGKHIDDKDNVLANAEKDFCDYKFSVTNAKDQEYQFTLQK
jgi:hypothetical protein